MSKGSTIRIAGESLIYSISPTVSLKQVVLEALGFIFAGFVVFQFSYDAITDVSPILATVYFLPFLILPDLIRKLKILVNGKRFCFSKQFNELYLNERRFGALDEINMIAIDYEVSGDSKDYSLALSFNERK